MDFKMNNDFFDEFTVLFTKDSSEISSNKKELGSYATQALKMDSDFLQKIDRAIRVFKEEFQVFLCARDVSSSAVAQEKLNQLWTLLGKLPAYDQLQPNDHSAEQLFRYMRQHPDEVDDMITSGTARNRMMKDWLVKLDGLTDSIRLFIRNTSMMLDDYFEDISSRKPEKYASVYNGFRYMIADALYRQEDDEDLTELASLRFSFPVKLSYEAHTGTKGKTVLAERMYFEDLVNFLYVDFYKGMAAGNLPRRCHNCKRYFLAIGAYDTRYCNEIAPGESKKTCRDVGAHKKEKRKSNSQPIIKEYNRVYNRLKGRKRSGSITVEEWNQQVAHIQQLKYAALDGKYSDAELKRIYDEI